MQHISISVRESTRGIFKLLYSSRDISTFKAKSFKRFLTLYLFFPSLIDHSFFLVMSPL